MRRVAPLAAGLLLAIAGSVAGLRALARARTVQLFGARHARVPTTEPRVALTFDDGPAPARTDTLLRVLASRGMRATFFVTGSELAAAPEAGRRRSASRHGARVRRRAS